MAPQSRQVLRPVSRLTNSLLSTSKSTTTSIDKHISSKVSVNLSACTMVLGKPSRINPGWQSSLAFWFEKVCYKFSDRVITASPGQREHIKNRFGELVIEVIPNASDISLFGKTSNETLPEWTKDKILFTHIGSLGLIHNTKYWLAVASELKKIDIDGKIKMVFIGDGADRLKLEELKKQAGLDNLIFLGLKPKSELPKWVQASYATLFATTNNPVQDTSSPNKVFDSFAAGVPIIQTSKGWIADLVEKEDCGVNIPLEDPAEGARLLYEFSKKREILEEKGKNAYRLAETIFNRDILAKKYLDIICEVLTKKKPLKLINN